MRIIRLTESDLEKIVKKVLKEDPAPLPDMENAPLGKVEAIQQALVDAGYDVGPTGVDGKFGSNTRAAVIKYQKDNGIKQTGNVGPLTGGKLGVQPLTSGKPSPTQPKASTRPQDKSKVPSFNLGNNLQPISKDNTYVKKPLSQFSGLKSTTTTDKKPITPTTTKSSKSNAIKHVAKCETGTVEVLLPDASLLFDGDKLYWIANGKTIKSWDAVSGLTWKNTPPKDWAEMTKKYTTNREAWAKDKNAGPLPEGTYSVGPLESRSGGQEEIGALEAFWYKLTGQVSDNDSDRQFCKNTILSRISWGNYRAPITPTGGQKMYGRGSFYLHGGSLRGSHGCIDLTDDIEDFAKFFGVWTSTTKKKKIPLTVKYKNPLLNQVIQKLVNLF
jgi:peptidoglycan hydrolase-like protein with peptidoglycan-binding domain